MNKKTVIVGFFLCFLAGVGLMWALRLKQGTDIEAESTVADTLDHSASPVPVTAADPMSGRPDALVTIVEFADFHCPFCVRPQTTLAQIKQAYGPSDVRVVWKNNPLPVHCPLDTVLRGLRASLGPRREVEGGTASPDCRGQSGLGLGLLPAAG